MSALRKNVASQVLTFNLVNATTGAALTGASVTTKVALDGTQSAGAGTVTELGTGQYKYVPTQGETNGTTVGFSFTASNAIPVNLHCFTIGQDPTQTTFQSDVAKWLGTAASTPTVAGVPNVNVKTWNDLTTVALPLVPTTAGRTLDVSATGEGGVDWANVGSPTTTLDLSGTTIKTTQKVDVETIKTQAVTLAGGVTFPAATLASTTNITAATGVDITKILGTAISTPATAGILDVNVKNIDNDAASASGTVTFPNATLASTTNITAGTITTATNVTTVNGLAAAVVTAASIAADAITAAKIADGAIDAATFAAGAINAAAIASDAITDAKVASDVTIASVTGAVGSVTGNVGGNVTGSVGSVATGGIAAASFSAGAIDNAAIAADAIGASELAADAVIEIQSGLSTLTAAGVRSAVGLASANLDTQLAAVPTATQNADALLKRDWTAVTGEASRSVLNALRWLRNKFTATDTLLTVCKEDDSTTAWTADLTRSSQNAIQTSDPS